MSEAKRAEDSGLRVSLVVPVRDEAETIDELLSSIAAQTRPPDEVLIVDGGSRDDTVARVRAAGA
ncbi:MAG TPA: glycosyltransferase, partial [Pyrinomonadaceae bacterium]|nr:glycosyltransferase [Pyrinomonadaceae bacterium]